jgi:hypothetical protein
MQMTSIHAIRTGLVEVRHGQMESRGAGLAWIAHMLVVDWTQGILL